MAEFIISAFADEADDKLEGQIAALKRNNISYIEPRSVSGNIIDKDGAELGSIASTLKDAGIGVSSLGSPIGKYNIEDDFAPHLEKFYKALEACRILGCHRMRIFSFFVKPEERKKYRDEVFSRLTTMLGIAKEYGVTLCHENESHIYGQDPAEVRDLLKNLPGLFGVFDAANYLNNGKSPIEGFEATEKKLAYIHVKDAYMGTRVNLPAGKGDGKYAEILKEVNMITDRPVFLTLEPHLYSFNAFKTVDRHEIATPYTFESSNAAFDFAAKSLYELLASIGFEEVRGVWKKRLPF